ncbi:hypothetical protein EV645_7379 [Kribbella rubisoli]|uniref:Uncharacterized protein n=1 Tax=Kribbella rubisoli TaxID=3075929 RepID=A0A4Q7W291_9ACTN|nr:hypothetical protein [Kribbella rubisoli]RZU03352.1 hypothetical protein EV645_7379 [Kribbella rubisoli]
MEPEATEPLEPDRIFTAEELLKQRDPRDGVADANGAVKRRPRLRRGGGRRSTAQTSERQNEGRRR